VNIDIGSITPVPTEEEAAAIAAAVTMMWPRPVSPTDARATTDANRWRFSGRWWASDAIVRRPRPGA